MSLPRDLFPTRVVGVSKVVARVSAFWTGDSRDSETGIFLRNYLHTALYKQNDFKLKCWFFLFFPFSPSFVKLCLRMQKMLKSTPTFEMILFIQSCMCKYRLLKFPVSESRETTLWWWDCQFKTRESAPHLCSQDPIKRRRQVLLGSSVHGVVRLVESRAHWRADAGQEILKNGKHE